MNNKLQSDTPKLLLYVTIIISLIITIFPIFYLVLTSIKPSQLLYSVPPEFFFKLSFESFQQVFIEGEAGKYLINSLIVTISSTIIAVFLGALAAFILAIVQFKYKKAFYFTILITRMYPPITTLIPIYLIMQFLGLLDTYPALTLPYAGTQIALATMILYSFYKDLPVSIFESALIDGCSGWNLFLKLALPLSKTGLVSAGILIFILDWNEFLFGLALTSTSAKTAPVALTSYLEQEGMLQWGAVASMGTLMITPIIIFVFVFRQYLIKGLTSGATKG
ncbi:carbohydrate ABC transporter permease [Bacillaceae bacterium CLA-AA-H227]|uniref:Carbohydrate ABC transporter permease n=1 Tax=Robertmurraya yapensis (ex Hitch et al 2024) TaxID=3133160 RepID=A0ACC6SFU9_9BACI